MMNPASNGCITVLWFLVIIAAIGPARAVVPDTVTAIYFFDVPRALEPRFLLGWKRIIACIRAHDAKFTALVYSKAEDRGRYVVLEPYPTWAGLERHEHDPDEAPCLALSWQRDVQPNFTRATGEYAQMNSKLSYMDSVDPHPAQVLWVTAYRFKPAQRANFVESQGKVAAAAAKIQWHLHFTGYDVYGAGERGPSFLYLSPIRSEADIGQNIGFSVEELMESVFGKAVANADCQKRADSLADEWSEIWFYDKDLSYVPAK